MSDWLNPPLVRRAGCARLWLLLVAVVWGSERIAAAVPDYHTRTWTTDDGLPYNSVNSVLQDSAGFMWFATGGGLARLDGREFREMRAPSEFRTVGFNIRGLAEER